MARKRLAKATTISRHSVLGVEGTGQLHCTYTDQRLKKVRYQVRVMKCNSPCESGVRLMHCESPCASGVRRMKFESPGAALRHKHCESPCASGVRRKKCGCPGATDEMLRIPMRVRGATPEMRISRSDSATHVLQNPHARLGCDAGSSRTMCSPHARQGCDARKVKPGATLRLILRIPMRVRGATQEM